MSGKSVTRIARPQKDLLRKFIFIMAYRNRTFHERFGGGEDDYDSNDRPEFIKYMHGKGFKVPKQVWLQNIRAFIDVDLELEEGSWLKWLKKHAYPMDATWFWKNMTMSYLCFCTPEDAEEEFVLTQNAYGVFEGPCSYQAWTDWHSFTPLNHRLIILMRSQFVGANPNLPAWLADGFAAFQHAAVARITSLYEDPAAARSWLEDLPVQRAATSYPMLRVSSGSGSAAYRFSSEDVFTFRFFRIPSGFVQRINSIFFEQAVLTDSIVYKSSNALRKALEFYLELEQEGFKRVVPEPNPITINAVAIKLACPKVIAHELWMRHQVHQKIGNILGRDGLHVQAFKQLEDFVFRLLYPTG